MKCYILRLKLTGLQRFDQVRKQPGLATLHTCNFLILWTPLNGLNTRKTRRALITERPSPEVSVFLNNKKKMMSSVWFNYPSKVITCSLSCVLTNQCKNASFSANQERSTKVYFRSFFEFGEQCMDSAWTLSLVLITSLCFSEPFRLMYECETINNKMCSACRFLCMKIKLIFIRKDFYGLVLKQRNKATLKWRILFINN